LKFDKDISISKTQQPRYSTSIIIDDSLLV